MCVRAGGGGGLGWQISEVITVIIANLSLLHHIHGYHYPHTYFSL